MEEEIKMKMESEKLNKKIRADKDQRRNEKNEQLKSTKDYQGSRSISDHSSG